MCSKLTCCKTLARAILAIVLLSCSMLQPLRADILTGLQAYWRFDDGSGSATALDFTGYGNTGTLTNFADPTNVNMWTNGYIGTGLLFDATSNYVSVANSTNVNFDVSRAFTLSAWVYLTVDGISQSNGAAILCKGVTGAESYSLDVSGGKFRVLMRNASGGSTESISSLTTPIAGQWYHVVGVYNRSAPHIVGMYVNGAFEAQSSGSLTTVFLNTHPLTIGAKESSVTSGYNRPFQGIIDEVRMYNRLFSGSDVAELYADTSTNYAPLILIQPAVTGSVNQGGAYTNGAIVMGNRPMSFKWYQNDVPKNNQTNANLVLNPAVSTDSGNYYVVASNAFGVVTSAVSTVTVFSAPSFVAPISTNVLLFAGSKATLSVTANGAAPLSYQWQSNNVVIPGATNASITLSNVPLGYSASLVCVVTNFVGSSSSTPISVSVIAAPTAPYPAKILADNPRSYWRLNEADNGLGNGNAGRIAHDYWGGDDGNYTNVNLAQPPYNVVTDPTDTSAQFGLTGLSIVDGYAGNIQGVDFGAPTGSVNFSIEAWINGAGQSINGAGIVSKGYGNGGEQFCLDNQSGTTGIRFFVRDAANGTHNCNSTVLPDFAWHHVVGVCDQASGLVSLYIDGRLAGTATITPGTGIRSSTGPMTIGARKSAIGSTSFNNQFYGQIDEVAVYNYALSPAQIQNHYTAAGTAPYFTQLPPASASLNEGGTLQLGAVVVGSTPLTNTWFDSSHGTNVTQVVVTSTNVSNAALTVNNVPAGWNGSLLQLTSANAFGSTNVSVNLTVIGGLPTYLQNLPPVVSTVAGKTYVYSVAVQGAEPFHYQWYSNNVPLAGQTSSSFVFTASPASYRVVVTNIYGATNSTTSVLTTVPTLSGAYASALLSLNPVGYWPLQETNAPAAVAMETNLGTLGKLGNALYAVTNANGDGVTGGTATFGQGGALTGVGDNDAAVAFIPPSAVNYAFIPHASTALSLRPPLTLEAWVNSSSTAFSDIIGQGHSGLNSAAGAGNGGGLRLSYGGNNGTGPNLQLFVYDGNGVNRPSMGTPGGTLSYGTWHHCVATYDGTNATLYIDGTFQNTAVLAMAIDNWSPISIGDGFWSGGKPNRGYTGLIDEVAVYTNVLSDVQITNHWLAGTSTGNYKQTVLNDTPMLYYRMDSTGYSTPDPVTFPMAVNYGSAPVNAVYAAGIVPGAQSGPTIIGVTNSRSTAINGVISCVNAGFDSAFNPTGTQPFTVMTWFKGNPSDGVMQTLISHGANWTLNLDGNTGKAVWNPGTAGSVTSPTVVNDGNWHMAAGVYNGTTVSLYIDGNPSGTSAGSSLTGDSVNDVWLGGNAAFTVVGSNEQFFSGSLAHAAVFTNALSGTQIQQLYNLAALPSLSLSASGNQITITYTGTLLSSTNVTGPYQPVIGATSPYVISASAAAQLFYRSSNP